MKEKKKESKESSYLSQRRIFPVLIICMGLLLCAYPWISNFFYERSADSFIESYHQQSRNLSEEKIDKLLFQAEKYNRELSVSKVKLTDPFSVQQKKNELNYNEMLTTDASGIMGVVEIPNIGVKLPIYHGTTQSVLEKGAGHLFGTSLPIGGKSTHCVLTGHTGLSSAKMFTDLAEIKRGDLFYLSVFSKTLAYQVDQISVVKPEDTKKLQIIHGEDHVTLVTCTPYGINDHRLLIRGTRTKYMRDQNHINNRKQNSQWMRTYQKAIAAGVLIISGLWVAGKLMKGRRKGR